MYIKMFINYSSFIYKTRQDLDVFLIVSWKRTCSFFGLMNLIGDLLNKSYLIDIDARFFYNLGRSQYRLNVVLIRDHSRWWLGSDYILLNTISHFIGQQSLLLRIDYLSIIDLFVKILIC